MYIPNPYFSNIPQFGDLKLDYVFVEDGYPILFTCKNAKRVFLCICRTLVPEQKWVISETTIEVLRKLSTREISIADAFIIANKKSCIAQWSKSNPTECYSVFPTINLGANDLPSPNLYLDEDDGEDAVDYVLALSREANAKALLEIDAQIKSEKDSIYSISKEVSTSINYGYVPHSMVYWEKTELLSVDTICFGNDIEHTLPDVGAIRSDYDVTSNNLQMYVCDAA